MNDSILSLSENASTSSYEGSEKVLWEKFRTGDNQAYARIYDRFAPRLLSYGRKITSDQQQIEDSIQDLFIELWKGRANLSTTDSIQFYLFRALRNKLSRQFRTKPMQDIEQAPDHALLSTIPFEQLLIAQEEATAQTKMLQRAICQLSERQQEVIHLRYYQHLDSQQIAEIMSINDQSVRNLQHSAIRSLRRLLDVSSVCLLICLLC